MCLGVAGSELLCYSSGEYYPSNITRVLPWCKKSDNKKVDLVWPSGQSEKWVILIMKDKLKGPFLELMLVSSKVRAIKCEACQFYCTDFDDIAINGKEGIFLFPAGWKLLQTINAHSSKCNFFLGKQTIYKTSRIRLIWPALWWHFCLTLNHFLEQ